MSEAQLEVSKINGVGVVRMGHEGPNILFLHPAGQLPLGMKEHLQQLAEVGQVYAPNIYDLIASSMSRGNKRPTFSDVVNEFTKLNLVNTKGRLGIVAASIGGSFAWEYVTQNPKEVDWIVAGSPTGWPLRRGLLGWIGIFAQEMILEAHKQGSPKQRQKDPGTKLFLGQLKKHPPSVIHGLRLAMNADAREQMPNIQLPVDLLWGRKDKFIPIWSGQKMTALMPNARLEIVSEYNHLWYGLQPEKLTGPALERVRTMPPVR